MNAIQILSMLFLITAIKLYLLAWAIFDQRIVLSYKGEKLSPIITFLTGYVSFVIFIVLMTISV